MKTKVNAQDVLISIGMIVKNEEDVLHRCLNSVKKLMQRLPCELIITDTGSTDKTVEIAKEYTDIITNFKWCNDFAAARNVALEKAKGKWFFYLDADEVITDELLDEIEGFFTSNEHKNFATVAIKLRNFTSRRKGSEYISRGGRLFDTSYGRRFRSPVHELVDSILPMKTFTNVITHYGYNEDDVKRIEGKKDRNMPLMKKYVQEHPDDLNMVYQLGVGGVGEESIQMLLHAKQLVGDNVTAHLGTEVFAALIQRYFCEGKYNETLELYNEFFSKRKDAIEGFGEMDLHYFAAQAYSKLQQNENADKIALEYLRLYELLNSGKVENNANMMMCVSPEYANEMTIMHANHFTLKKEYEGAISAYLKGYFETDKVNAPDIVTIVCSLVLKTNDATWLSLLYEQVLKMKNDVLRRENIRKIATVLCHSDFAFVAKSLFKESFAKMPITWAINMFYLGLDEEDMPKAIEMMPICKDEGCDLLVAAGALRGEQDLNLILADYSSEDIYLLIGAFEGIGDKSAKFLCSYAFERAPNETGRAALYILSALEIVVDTLDCESDKLRFGYVDALLCLYRKMARVCFGSSVINGEMEFFLPEKYRFALMTEGYEGIEAIKVLKNALAKCKSMHYIADILLQKIEKDIEIKTDEEIARKAEWEQLATGIKAEINRLIDISSFAEAVAVLDGYEKVAPTDKDIVKLRQKLLLADNANGNKPS